MPMESAQFAADLRASLGTDSHAFDSTLSRTPTQLKRSSSVRKRSVNLGRKVQDIKPLEQWNESIVLNPSPESRQTEHSEAPLHTVLGADDVASTHFPLSTYEKDSGVQKKGTNDQSQHRSGAIDVQHTTRPKRNLKAVQRSTSTPFPSSVISGHDERADSHPTRGISLSGGNGTKQNNAAELDDGLPALNGVSIFYSSKDKEISMPIGHDRPSQMTNSQKIRRYFSLQERRRTIRSSSIIRTCTMRNLRPLLKNVPFSRLMRSGSLEDLDFLESLKQLQAIRNAMDDAARSKHWFHAGQISVSSRSTVMRAAFPALKCISCPRMFRGADRKRRYARHCKKLHHSPSLGADARKEKLEPGEKPIISSKRREGVLSADEFLQTGTVETLYEMCLSALPQDLGSLHIENAARPNSEAMGYLLNDPSDTENFRKTESGLDASLNSPSAQTIWVMPTTSTARNTANDSENIRWKESSVAWTYDRINHAALAPIIEAGPEQVERAEPLSYRCSHCAVKYTGSHAPDFLERHIFAKHRKGKTELTNHGIAAKQREGKPNLANQGIALTTECNFCNAEFYGEHRKRVVQQHEALCLSQSNLGPMTRFRVPPEVCSICDKMFLGKYRRGNLARHKIAKHSTRGIRNPVGHQCRACGDIFHHAGARRKHEWSEHLLWVPRSYPSGQI